MKLNLFDFGSCQQLPNSFTLTWTLNIVCVKIQGSEWITEIMWCYEDVIINIFRSEKQMWLSTMNFCRISMVASTIHTSTNLNDHLPIHSYNQAYSVGLTLCQKWKTLNNIYWTNISELFANTVINIQKILYSDHISCKNEEWVLHSSSRNLSELNIFIHFIFKIQNNTHSIQNACTTSRFLSNPHPFIPASLSVCCIPSRMYMFLNTHIIVVIIFAFGKKKASRLHKPTHCFQNKHWKWLWKSLIKTHRRRVSASRRGPCTQTLMFYIHEQWAHNRRRRVRVASMGNERQRFESTTY